MIEIYIGPLSKGALMPKVKKFATFWMDIFVRCI